MHIPPLRGAQWKGRVISPKLKRWYDALRLNGNLNYEQAQAAVLERAVLRLEEVLPELENDDVSDIALFISKVLPKHGDVPELLEGLHRFGTTVATHPELNRRGLWLLGRHYPSEILDHPALALLLALDPNAGKTFPSDALDAMLKTLAPTPARITRLASLAQRQGGTSFVGMRARHPEHPSPLARAVADRLGIPYRSDEENP